MMVMAPGLRERWAGYTNDRPKGLTEEQNMRKEMRKHEAKLWMADERLNQSVAPSRSRREAQLDTIGEPRAVVAALMRDRRVAQAWRDDIDTRLRCKARLHIPRYPRHWIVKRILVERSCKGDLPHVLLQDHVEAEPLEVVVTCFCKAAYRPQPRIASNMLGTKADGKRNKRLKRLHLRSERQRS